MRRAIFAFVLLQLLLMSAHALNWEQTVALARRNAYALKSAASQTEAARWTYYKSFTPFLPQLSASASIGETTSGTPAATAKSTAYGLGVTQPLFTGLENFYNNQAQRTNYDYYLATQQKTEADLYYDVRKAFVDLALAAENIELLKNILERRKNNADMIELRFDSGREDEGALKRTRADEAEAVYNLNVAQRDKDLARLNLRQLISAEAEKIEDKLEVRLPANPDFNALLPVTPGYIRELKQYQLAEIAYQQTISGFLPSVSLSGSYRKTGSDWPPAQDSNSWSLNFSYSLFPGGGNIADRILYAARQEQARQDFLKAGYDLRYTLESAFKGLRDGVEAQKTAQLYVDASTLRAEIARTKYLNGLVSYDEWDRIENDYINYQKSLLARKKAALYAEAAWHNAYGGYLK